MLIHPEVIVTPDCPTIKFREPQEKVDLNIELPKILGVQGWGVGTYFNVQFIDHDRTKLLASGTFVVAEENESLHTANPDGYQPNTKTVSARKAKQIGDWFYLVKPETTSQISNVQVKWNPGKKVHEVKRGDEVLYASADKDEAERARETA